MMLDRRQFIALAGGMTLAISLGACDADDADPDDRQTDPAAQRVLVVVQLHGGNDALNTLVPADGRYRDARPTLAIAEDDVLALAGEDAWGLHPALAPLLGEWEAGRMSCIPGIGFADPNRSHFVSMDRWWRADHPADRRGWLGRQICDDQRDPSPRAARAPLYATSLGQAAPLLASDLFEAATVIAPRSFRLPTVLPGAVLRTLDDSGSASGTKSNSDLASALGASCSRAVECVTNFQRSGVMSIDGLGGADDTFAVRQQLEVAAVLATNPDVRTRIIVVSAGGFDTHADQPATHAALLGDVAAGIRTFLDHVRATNRVDRVLLVTTSEFGRRIHENASRGTDHGAGGLSMMFGASVVPGVRSAIDLGDSLDGDIRPTVDPRTLMTACLDWLGQDPAAALGRRYDELALGTW